MKQRTDLPILICSYDQCYRRWPIVQFFIAKHWAQCPYPIYLGANGSDQSAACPKEWVYVNTGPDKSWATSMLDYLKYIPGDYVLLWVDDTALLAEPNQQGIDTVFNFMQSTNAARCLLNPRPGPNMMINDLLGHIDVAAGVPYITSWTNVIWKKTFLMELLRYNFNAWEFEMKAGKTPAALAHQKDFYACKKPVIRYMHFVEKNNFDPEVISLLNKANSKLDLSGLPFLRGKQLIKVRLQHYFAKLQTIVPARYQNRLRRWLGLTEL